MKCLIHDIQMDGLKNWACPLCDLDDSFHASREDAIAAMESKHELENSEEEFRKRFSIRKMKDCDSEFFGDDSFNGELLVLCIDGRRIPFQTKTVVESSRENASRFLVDFEIYTGGLEIK